MNSLFNFDNPIFQFLGHIVDVVILNFLFILCCIPIITIGPSISALYYCMLKIAREQDSSIIGMFFHSFRANLKQGILMTILFIALAVFLIVDIHACNVLNNNLLEFIKIILYFLSFILFVIVSYAFPLLAQFENTTRNILKTALSMAYIYFGYTAIIVLLNAIPLILFFLLPELFVVTLPIWLSLGFALIVLLNAKMFVKIFDKYIPDMPNL